MTRSSSIRLAMLGMIEGNGHPWSWSAIINGYDPVAMEQCPYPVIREYLGRQPAGSVGIDGAEVTHIWTDDPSGAASIAAATRISHVVGRAENVIGAVDAVIIATDDGGDHVRRAAPFVEAGVPVFVDKPLATNLRDLQQFASWVDDGKSIFSTSGLRYAPEMAAASAMPLESIRWITSFTCKSWERYGIHALEAVYPVLGEGFESVQAISRPGADIMHITHRTGCLVTVAAIEDALGSFGSVHLYGTKGDMAIKFEDTYTAFRRQLTTFIKYLETEQPPFSFNQTIELMLILIAGNESRAAGGAAVSVKELWQKLRNSPKAKTKVELS